MQGLLKTAALVHRPQSRRNNMLKIVKAAALMCGLLFVHLPHAHAAWQRMYSGNPVPWNAVTNDDQFGNLYPCRATYGGGVHPGWFSTVTNVCAIGWGGKEIDSYVWDIWVSDWEPATNGNVPANAIAFGYERPSVPYPGISPTRERYACQAADPAGGVASGKVAPDLGGCFFPWGGTEHYATSYKVLVDSELSMVDSTGGPKLTVASYDPSSTSFVGPYTQYPPYYDTLWMAITSGYEANGQRLYLCSAPYQDGIQIGKVTPGSSGCDVSYGGQEVPNLSPSYTLGTNWQESGMSSLSIDYNWPQIPIDQQIAPPSGQYPGGLYQSAIIAGHEADGSNLYLCGAGYGIGPALFTPGKFSVSIGGCSFGANGKEVVSPSYIFLTETYTKPTPVAR